MPGVLKSVNTVPLSKLVAPILLNTAPPEKYVTSPDVFAEYRTVVPSVPAVFISYGINECKSVPPVIGTNCLRFVTPVAPISALLIFVVTSKSTLIVSTKVFKSTSNDDVETEVTTKLLFAKLIAVLGAIPYRALLALSERTKQIILFRINESEITPEPVENEKESVPEAVTVNLPAPVVVPEYFFLTWKSILLIVLALIASYGVSKTRLVFAGSLIETNPVVGSFESVSILPAN